MTDQPLARLRAICLALPEAAEVVTWETVPTFRVGGKIFALYEERLGDAPRIGCWCKAPPGVQAALVAADPGRYYAPPYLGGRGWLGLRFDGALDWAEVAAHVEESYLLVAPKRQARALVAANAEATARPPKRPAGNRRT